MAAPPAQFIDILNKIRGLKVKGNGGWIGFCPSHDDRMDRSLSIDIKDDKLLLLCFAGCTVEQITAAIGQTTSDLFEHREVSSTAAGVKAMIRWVIRDVGGQVVAEHFRYDLADGGKRYAWFRNSEWKLGDLKVNALPLYGIHELPTITQALDISGEWIEANPFVILTEGEKARDALQGAGYHALGTVTGAAGTPSDNVLAVLKPHDVFLWPDNDVPGHAHMDRIASRLESLHICFLMVNWLEAPPRGDAADAVKMGIDIGELLGHSRHWERETAQFKAPSPETQPFLGNGALW